MGQGHSSGQRLPIRNNTEFIFRKERVVVTCGREWKTPAEILPFVKKLQKSPLTTVELLLDLKKGPISAELLPYIENSGRRSSRWGSEIKYEYRIVGTPDGAEWYLTIISNGAYYRGWAYCVVQLFKAGEMMAQESLWGAVKDYPSFINEACPFHLAIEEPKRRKDIGSGFYEIPITVEMKEFCVGDITKDDEIFMGEQIVETKYQDLTPGKHELSREDVLDCHISVKRKVDHSWGRSLNFQRRSDSCFNLGINVQKLDMGVNHAATDETKHVYTEDSSTENIIIRKHSYKWTWTHKSTNCETVRLEIKKKIYRQNLVWRDTDHEEVVGFNERYEYSYTLSKPIPHLC